MDTLPLIQPPTHTIHDVALCLTKATTLPPAQSRRPSVTAPNEKDAVTRCSTTPSLSLPHLHTSYYSWYTIHRFKQRSAEADAHPVADNIIERCAHILCAHLHNRRVWMGLKKVFTV